MYTLLLNLVCVQCLAKFVPNEEALSIITSMGFSIPQATKALKATDNNVERAADWIFSHANELDEEERQSENVFVNTENMEATQEKFDDGSSSKIIINSLKMLLGNWMLVLNP